MCALTFNPLSQTQWVHIHRKELQDEFDSMDFDFSGLIDCVECDGVGSWRDSHDNKEYCDVCGGSGQVEKTYDDAFDEYCYDEYCLQVSKDRVKYAWYSGIIQQGEVTCQSQKS